MGAKTSHDIPAQESRCGLIRDGQTWLVGSGDGVCNHQDCALNKICYRRSTALCYSSGHNFFLFFLKPLENPWLVIILAWRGVETKLFPWRNLAAFRKYFNHTTLIRERNLAKNQSLFHFCHKNVFHCIHMKLVYLKLLKNSIIKNKSSLYCIVKLLTPYHACSI